MIGGLTTNRNFTIKFKRDNEGKLDMRNGNFCNKKVQILNCKYEKECRLGLGCAMVTPRGPIEGSFLPIIGKRCLPFDYSEKVLLSVSDYEKKMEAEFRRVKSLSAKTGYWIESTREEGKLYCDDKVTVLKKAGKKVGQKLENAQFTVLSDLKKVTDPDAVTVDGITKKSFRSLWEQAQLSSVDASPQPIDHRKSPNPYQSKFGDRWEDHLKKSSTFSASIVVTNYIIFMMEQSAAIMKGTNLEDDWVVYHDSLSIMTAAKTKQWMEEQGFLSRWILPTTNLYDDDLELRKRYSNNPLGNSPELMPWDTHLNQDVHSSHDFHVTSTSHLPEDHDHKFSGSTPKRMARSYKRILHPTEGVAPTDDRIIQDIKRIIPSLQSIFDAEGVLINENIKGRRFVKKHADQKRNWGGSRVKKEITYHDVLLHRHAAHESKYRLNKSINKLVDNDNNVLPVSSVVIENSDDSFSIDENADL